MKRCYSIPLLLFGLLLLLGLTVTAVSPVMAEPANTGKFERKTDRDPFMPPVGPIVEKTAPVNVTKTAPPVKTVKAVDVKPKDIAVSSGFVLTGIVTADTGLRAVVRGPEKTVHVVTAGKKIGPWTVISIRGKSVVLRQGNQVDTLELIKNTP